MNIVRFSKMHGAGNDFILIDDRDERFPVDDHRGIAAMATRPDGIGCEGVIVLQRSAKADFKMRFFNPDGTEADLCGNGARCVAAFARAVGAVDSDSMRFETAAGFIDAEIVGPGKVKVSMPLPEKCKVRNFGRYKLPVVKFDGISHTIVTERMPKPLAEMMIREWANKVRADAFGILLMSKDYREMTPLVYVKSTDTVVAESSCASGTAAVGAWLAVEKKEPVNLTIRQPGGELSIEVEVTDGNVSKLLLGGHVSCVEEGQMQAEEKVFHLKHD